MRFMIIDNFQKFTSKKNGKEYWNIQGRRFKNLYSNVHGHQYGQIYLPAAMYNCDDSWVNKVADVEFNERGFVSEFKLLEK